MAPAEVRTPHSRVPSPVSILTDLSQLPVFSDYYYYYYYSEATYLHYSVIQGSPEQISIP